MLLQDPNLRVWLYTQPTDMRKQFDGLAALVNNKMAGTISEEHLFVFINRRRTHMKALYYSKGGLCLWCKRLERGHFYRVAENDNRHHKTGLSWAQLQCVIDGIYWQKNRKNKRL
ncbi:MAG: IS66 family insertion sequence element accessory protein TnpB [Cyanobacteria bacterium P01_H01_bin.152]